MLPATLNIQLYVYLFVMEISLLCENIAISKH